jgi:hypothetical protein
VPGAQFVDPVNLPNQTNAREIVLSQLSQHDFADSTSDLSHDGIPVHVLVGPCAPSSASSSPSSRTTRRRSSGCIVSVSRNPDQRRIEAASPWA